MRTTFQKYGLPTLLAALGLLGLCLGLKASARNVWPLALTALAWLGGAYWLGLRDKRLKGTALVCGLLASVCLLLGQRLERLGTVAGGGMGWLMLAMLCFAPALGALFALAVRGILASRAPKKRVSGAAFFALSYGAVLLCWLPAFLALYPGVFAYDVMAQLVQGGEMPYSKHHALLHTLWLCAMQNFTQVFGDPNAGVAMNAIFQLLIVPLPIAHAAGTLRKANSPAWAYLAVILLPALLPCGGVMAVSTVKDVFFSASVLWSVTQLYIGCHWPEKRKQPLYWLATAVAVALMCLLRNNGLYALLSALALALVFAGRNGRRMIAAALCGLVLFFGASTALDAALDPVSGHSREMMSVPIQQMARAITRHPEWREDADVKALFQGEVQYYPTLADPPKAIFRTGGETPMSQVARLWLRLLRAYPSDYADAFLLLTRGWWDVNDLTYTTVYGHGYGGYVQTIVQNAYDVQRKPIVPALEDVYLWLVADNGYQSIPVYNLLCAPALWFWAVLFVLLSAWYMKKTHVLAVALIPFGIWLTVMLGPCCLVRYGLPILLCAPVVLGMLAAPENE